MARKKRNSEVVKRGIGKEGKEEAEVEEKGVVWCGVWKAAGGVGEGEVCWAPTSILARWAGLAKYYREQDFSSAPQVPDGDTVTYDNTFAT
jgi:hypothetical protein